MFEILVTPLLWFAGAGSVLYLLLSGWLRPEWEEERESTWHRDERLRAKAAGVLGLKAIRPGQLEGSRDGREVVVDCETVTAGRSPHLSVTCVRVISGPSEPVLLIRGAGLVDGFDFTTGDTTFDALFNLGPPAKGTLARFPHPVRRRLQELLEQGLSVSRGEFRIERRTTVNEAEFHVRQLLELANDLVVEVVPTRLAQIAARDPLASVRRRALEELERDHLEHPETLRVAATMLDDDDHATMLLARRLVLTGASPLERRAQVLAALESPEPAVRKLALEHLPPAVDDALLDAITGSVSLNDDLLSVAVARAVERLGRPRAEQAMRLLLWRDSPEVQLAAIRALGAVGTLSAVEELLERTAGFATPGALKEAAREAIRTIQAREGAADAGRLSIAEAAEGSGALSLATAGGELSIAIGPTKAREQA